MKDDMMQILSKLNSENKCEGIIQLTLPITLECPNDISARYCLAMAYIAKGDMSEGLEQLQIIIIQSQDPNKSSELNRLFVARVMLQTVEIAELSLHAGDVLGEKTLQMVKNVKDFGHNSHTKDLRDGAEDILKRWVHLNSLKQPIIAFIPDSPLTLQVEPTNACNLRCTMCPRSKMTRKLGSIDPAVFEEMLGGWKNRVYVKQVRHLIFGTTLPILKRGSIKLFFMGEPLIHNQIDKLIESGNQAGCKVGIQTNGIALKNEEVRRRLLAAKPSAIGISLDGISEMSYQSVRQGASWPEVCKGIEELNKERREMNLEKEIMILVSSIIPEWNQSALERAKRFLEPIRPFVDQIGYIPLSRERDPEFYNEDGKIIKYGKQLATETSKFEPMCTEPFTKLNVLWDGRIAPCCYDIDCEMQLGDVKDGVDNVWNSNKVKELQTALLNRDFKKYALCSACMKDRKM